MDMNDIMIEDDDNDFLSDNDFLDDDINEEEEDINELELNSDDDIDDNIIELDDDNQSITSETCFENIKSQTIPRLTKYEKANILGLRATQIQSGSKPFINIKALKEITPISIAEEELKQRKLNFFKIKRVLPSGKHEIISLKHLNY